MTEAPPHQSMHTIGQDRRTGSESGLIGSRVTPADQQGSIAIDPITPTRVLVVEDNPGLRNVVGLVLQKEGYEVLTALNGAEALERVREWRPDVILLDIIMPVMDGTEFVRAYRQESSAPVPIIALTAIPERAEEIKADYVLQKPIDIDALLGAIERSTHAH
ncbi:MAG TPA: response regulator [Chloroflexota bacterium]|nr:response regulator [Chloroflexota bacterium]